jgi:hypothetical protein
MPADYEYNAETRRLRTKLWGSVSDADLVLLAKSVAEDERIVCDTKELVDLSGVERVNVSQDGLRSVTEVELANPEKFQGFRSAIVAPTDLLYGMARMFENLSKSLGAPSRNKAFRDEEAARAWLDQP